MRLLSQSTRATIRTITLLAALTSLLLTMLTPFVGSAQAAHADPYNATNGDLDNPAFTHVQDDCGGNSDDIAKGGTKLDTIHADSPPVITQSSVTPKDNLCDFWVDSTVDEHGDVWLYAAFTRATTGGTAHVAIELLDSAATCDVGNFSGCNPWMNRTDGTRIIGFTWQGNDGLIDPTLWTFNGGFDAGQPLGDAFFGSTGQNGAFGEIAVNLADADILPNVNETDECELIAAVIPLTLPGLSLGSQPKDVVLGDFPPIQTCGSIEVVKQVVGGDDFGATFPITVADGTIDETQSLGHGGSFTVDEAPASDTYTVSEDLSGLTGWSIVSISCDDGSGNEGETSLDGISVEAGETTTCTVTNEPDLPTITLEKDVINDNGGDATEANFQAHLDGSDVDWDVATTVTPGTHAPSETMLVDGYTQVSITCDDTDGGETATVNLGDDVTCTIVNDDDPGELILEKVIVDEDWLYPGVTQDDFVPTIDDGDADWGSNTVDADTYTIDEHDADGSTLLADGTFVNSSTVCDGQETSDVTVANGQTSTCTITNTAVGSGLTVIKQVENSWGGELGPSDFPLTVNGDTVVSGQATTFPAGDYAVAEQQQAGYELSDSFCTRDGESVHGIDGESFDISVGPGETVICTFVNQDIPATITLDKTVVNDNGGTLDQDDFPSFLDGNPLAWDATIDIPAGDHTASETPQDGYAAGDWGGDCAVDGTFTAELATDYVCTITNDDIGSELTLEKVVINDDGGTATKDDFTPTADYDGTGDASGVTNNPDWATYDVPAGEYTIGELLDVEGYELGDIVCQRNGDTFASSTENDLVIEIGLDDDVTCTVTNDDQPASLTLSKEVINDDGGTATQVDFIPTVEYDGTGDASAVTESPDWDTFSVPAGTYTVGELVAAGYLQEGVECTVDGETITGGATATFDLANGGTADCVVTNNDIGPGLTVVKQVVNDDGGTLGADDFPLEVTDSGDETTLVESGASNDVPADIYTIGEQQQDGYELTELSCLRVDGDEQVPVGDIGDGGTTITVDLGLAQTVVCTLVNDDIAPLVTLTKTVVNDDGGTLSDDDFAVTFDGEDATWGEQFATTAGDHAAAEQAQPGYLAGDWGGDCAADGSLTTEPGGVYECTITNDDVPAGLTVVKEVVNDDDGSLGVEDFPLLVTPEGGDTEVVDSGAVNTLPAGTYTIGEEQQDGYTLDSIVCDNGVEAADGEDTVTVTVANGESVICTITNNDPEPVVLGEQFEEPEPKPAPAQLPRTGLDTGRLALWALLITALGVLFLVVTAPAPAAARRRI